MVSKEKMLVQFENVQEKYFIDDAPMKIEYILNIEYEPSTKDWLGIFPKGWRELEQQVMGEYAVTRSSKDNRRKRLIEFNLSYLLIGKMNCFNADYQIVYVSKHKQVIGKSSYFRLQRKYGDVLSHGDNAGVFEGSGTAHITASISSTALLKSINPNSPSKAIVQTVNCGGVGFPLVKPYRSESVLPYYARDYVSRCRYCSNLMHQNQSLMEQVKELAHINRQLNQSFTNLQQKFELSAAAQKRLKLWCYCLRQEKHGYEVFVGELLKCLQGNSTVCVRDPVKGSEMLVQRVNADLNNHILSHPMRHGTSVSDRYLKAIIGSQEMKIQELSAKLHDVSKRLAQYEINPERKSNDYKLLEFKSNKHSDFEEYENDKNNQINCNVNSHGEDDNADVQTGKIDKSNEEIIKKNGYNKKSAEEVHAIIEVCRINEKLEAVICDVNNNCGFSDNDEDDNDNVVENRDDNHEISNICNKTIDDNDIIDCSLEDQ